MRVSFRSALIASIFSISLILSSCNAGGIVIGDDIPSTLNDITPLMLTYMPSGVATGGNLACILGEDDSRDDITENYGVVLLDITDLSNPRYITTFTGFEETRAAQIVDGVIYVADGYGGLKIIDARNPELAQVVFTTAADRRIIALTVEDGMLYTIADDFPNSNRAGFMIYDLADPVSPVLINEIELSYFNGKDIEISHGHAYIAMLSYGLDIVDIDPPEEASVVWTQSMDYRVDDVEVVGDYLYYSGGEYSGGLNVMSLADPSNPVLHDVVEFQSGIDDLSADNGQLYILDEYNGIYTYDPDIPGTVNLYSLNISLRFGLKDMTMRDGIAYCYKSRQGLIILDAGNLVNIRLLGKYYRPSISEFVAEDGYLYAADGNGAVLLYDIDPPENAHLVSSLTVPDAIYDIELSNGYIYCAGKENLHVIHAIPPTELHLVNSVPAGGYDANLMIDGTFAYIVRPGRYFTVYDLSVPSHPIQVGELIVPDARGEIVASEGYALVLSTIYDGFDSTCMLNVIHVDPPGSASVTESITLEDVEFVRGLFYKSPLVYVQTRDNVMIYDLTKPGCPEYACTLNDFDNVVDVMFRNRELVVYDQLETLKTYDLSSPLFPELVSNVPVSMRFSISEIYGDLLIGYMHTHGLRIMRFN